MGNLFGLGGTVTAGIVSAQGRKSGSGPYDDGARHNLKRSPQRVDFSMTARAATSLPC
jgi:S1-C subfamily serine protease